MTLPISTLWWIFAAIVIITSVITWILLSKGDSCKNYVKRLERVLEISEDWFSNHWYTVLLVACSVFVIMHFEACLSLTFSADFNGYNTIFIFWLILLIIPLFEKLEVSGFSVRTRKQLRLWEASYEAAIEATNNNNPLNAEELEELHNNGGHDE